MGRIGRKISGWVSRLRKFGSKVGGAIRTGARFISNNADKINTAINTGTNIAHQIGNAVGGKVGNAINNGANRVSDAQGKVNSAVNRFQQARAQR